MRRVATVLRVLLADARSHRLQAATTLLGVAAGVAVVVAIHLASNASLLSFQRTYGTLAGAATHQVTAIRPMPTSRLPELLAQPGVLHAQPVVEASVALADRRPDGPRTLRVLGVDPFLSQPFFDRPPVSGESAPADLLERLMTVPGTAILAAEDIARLGVRPGERVAVRGPTREATILVEALDGLPASGSGAAPLALMDIASAQEILELGGGVLRYDLVVDESVDAGTAVALAPGESLERPARRGERAGTLTAAFRTNLLALGFLAVLVGGFLVFNMAQFAVTRRRPMLGKLRCLGCSARVMLHAVLAEAVVVGTVGGVLGIALGRLLAISLVDDVALTVSTLYGHIETPTASLDPLTALGALALAIAVTVSATWAPARSAARTPPAVVAGATVRDPPVRLRVPLALLALSVLLLLPPQGGLLLPALAVLSLLLGVATLVPLILGQLARRPPRRGTLLPLAAGRLQRSQARTGAAAGALIMPIAMTIGITIMIGSFQREVVTWVDATIGADIYVKPLDQELAPLTARLDDALLAHLEALPDVVAVDILRGIEQHRDDRSFLVAGARLSALEQRGSLRILEGERVSAFERARDGEVLISEPLHRKTGLGAGDAISLSGATGERSLPIAAVFQDFSFDRGYVLMTEEHYLTLFGETGVRNAALLLRPNADPDALAAELGERFPRAQFTTTETIRADVMKAFDDTFRVTWSLQFISTALALVGILTGLLCLHLERRFELGVLRSLGSTNRLVGRLLLVEALLIVGLDVVLAIPVGGALAWILVAVVNTRSFGWSFPMVFDWGEVGAMLALAIGAGLLAALVPWLLVRRARIAELLRPTGAAVIAALLLTSAAGAQDGFLRALPGRPVMLPRDHGSHRAARTEWWYFTGPLTSADGQEFGFQATWFRRALVPEPVKRDSPLGAQSVMMFHGNLVDTATGELHSTERVSREHASWAHAAETGLDLHLLGNSLVATDDTVSSAELVMHAGDARVRLALDLGATTPLLHGDDEGLSAKGDEPGQASWYYSFPRIAVRGEIELPGRAHLAVTGTAWFDHEFGSSVLAPEQAGWDWFSVALDDGTDVMAFDLRRRDGSRDRNSAGTLRTSEGRVARLRHADFSIDVQDTWTSPDSDVTYPSAWTLRVPGEGLELSVVPVVPDQEITTPASTSVTYWEGLCRFEGTRDGRPVAGRGYVELVGYGAPFTARF